MAELPPESQTETYDLWDRVGYVEISIGDKSPMVFKGLDFKFKVTKVLASMVEGTMTVDIHGLPQDKINEIVTVCSQAEAINQRKRVKVYAGYRDPDDSNYEGDLIACMDIIYASVTSPPPDLWVTIEGVQSNFYSKIGFKYNIEAGFDKTIKRIKLVTLSNEVSHLLPGTRALSGSTKYRVVKSQKISPNTAWVDVELWYQKYVTIEQVCENLIESINKAFERAGQTSRVKCEFYLSDNSRRKKVPSFTFSGSMSELPNKIGAAFDVFCFFEYSYGSEDVLVVMDKTTENPGTKISQEERDLINVNRGKRHVRYKVLDVDHGLIGIPTIANTTSLRCRCLLDPRLTVGDYIDISSEVMPVVKSTYPGWQINKVSFSGHLRGNEWYTDITAIDFKRMKSTKEFPMREYNLNV